MRTGVALATTLGLLAGFHAVRRSVIPDEAHFVANTAMIGVLAVPALAASMTAAELGMSRATLGRGLRVGAVTVGAAAVVTGAAVLLGAGDTDFVRDRTAFGLGEVVFQVFVEIPIATVVLEEFAFRGVVAGLLERLLSARAALACSSLLFGLWHVSPGDVGSLAEIGPALATIAATSLAGAGFHLLKRRSGSLVAPMLAHWATNGVTLAVAWLAVRATT
jgi:membrane protease YdiL (CAAX protease family)